MEGISQDTLNVIKSAASSFPEADVDSLCKLVFAEATGTAGSLSTEKVLEKHLSGVDPAKAKQAHAALLDFVLESAKSDLEPEDVTSNLEEINASDKLTTPLVAGFREHKAAIRARLQKIGHSFPQVTGMNWRLDYTLRSSSGGKVMLPTYVISLKTLNGAGVEDTVQFTCNREQLKDFLRKVEDAETQVERAIGATK